MELTHFVFGKFTRSNSAGRPPDYKSIIYSPQKPSADTLNWLQEQITAVLPERHTASPKLLLHEGATWLYVSVFPSLPGEQGGPNGILRYHAVRLSDAELDTLRWHPWSLDNVLITGIREDSLTGSNPQFRVITVNSPETEVRIDIDLEEVAAAPRPVREYLRATEAIIKAFKDGQSFYLLESADSSEASEIVSAVLRHCRANNMTIPSVATELTFVSPKPLRHTLLKIVAAEPGNPGNIPERWTGLSADALFKQAVAMSDRADTKYAQVSTVVKEMSEITEHDSAVASDAENAGPTGDLSQLHELLDSREETSNVLKTELTAALSRAHRLEQELSALRGSEHRPGAFQDQAKARGSTPKWAIAAGISLALFAVISSVCWFQTSRQLRLVNGELDRLKPALLPGVGKNQSGGEEPRPGGTVPDNSSVHEGAAAAKMPGAETPSSGKPEASEPDPDDCGGTTIDQAPDCSATPDGTTLAHDPAGVPKKPKRKK